MNRRCRRRRRRRRRRRHRHRRQWTKKTDAGAGINGGRKYKVERRERDKEDMQRDKVKEEGQIIYIHI